MAVIAFKYNYNKQTFSSPDVPLSGDIDRLETLRPTGVLPWRGFNATVSSSLSIWRQKLQRFEIYHSVKIDYG